MRTDPGESNRRTFQFSDHPGPLFGFSRNDRLASVFRLPSPVALSTAITDIRFFPEPIHFSCTATVLYKKKAPFLEGAETEHVVIIDDCLKRVIHQESAGHAFSLANIALHVRIEAPGACHVRLEADSYFSDST